MKVICLLATVAVSCVVGEAPYPPSGWKPSGALLVLPSRQQEAPQDQYGPPPNPIGQEYGPPTPFESQPSDQGRSELERLKQQEGSESGVYHVLLPDGRLQKVEYATAPQADNRPDASANYRQQQQQAPQQQAPQQQAPQQQAPQQQARQQTSVEPQDVVATFGRLRGHALAVGMTPAQYLASLRYSDVQPVPPPIYAQNESPSLVRIVRGL